MTRPQHTGQKMNRLCIAFHMLGGTCLGGVADGDNRHSAADRVVFPIARPGCFRGVWVCCIETVFVIGESSTELVISKISDKCSESCVSAAS